MSDDEQRWYREGLRFGCTRCGRCCRGTGNVWVSDDEISELAVSLDLPDEDFRRVYTRRSGPGIVLGQQRNQDCVFWSASSGCEVYESRPRQCRTYPFWRGVVHSRESWETESRSCPGIDEGELHSEHEITRIAAADGIPDHRTRTLLEGG